MDSRYHGKERKGEKKYITPKNASPLTPYEIWRHTLVRDFPRLLHELFAKVGKNELSNIRTTSDGEHLI